jgi:hypothetical protein
MTEYIPPRDAKRALEQAETSVVRGNIDWYVLQQLLSYVKQQLEAHNRYLEKQRARRSRRAS